MLPNLVLVQFVGRSCARSFIATFLLPLLPAFYNIASLINKDYPDIRFNYETNTQ